MTNNRESLGQCEPRVLGMASRGLLVANERVCSSRPSVIRAGSSGLGVLRSFDSISPKLYF